MRILDKCFEKLLRISRFLQMNSGVRYLKCKRHGSYYSRLNGSERSSNCAIVGKLTNCKLCLQSCPLLIRNHSCGYSARVTRISWNFSKRKQDCERDGSNVIGGETNDPNGWMITFLFVRNINCI